MDNLTVFFVFIGGLIAGSFLNVCIVRMPKEESVICPSSHCVHCKKPIPWYDNIPLLSYLILGGRCRFCKEGISIRYFIVESLTGILFVAFYDRFGFSWQLAAYGVFLGCLIVATFVDIEHKIIPDEVSVGGMIVGFILSLLLPVLHETASPLLAAGRSLLGILVGGGAIYGIGVLGDFIFRKESMGGGDVKFLAMIGAFLGWKAALLTFFVAPLFGAVVGIIVKIRTKESIIPYGPFLALGALISLFWSDRLILWVISGYGF